MNIYEAILLALVSIIYFEFKLIPVWWMRVSVYILFFILMPIWSGRRERRLLTKWQQFVGSIQSGNHKIDFSSKAFGKLTESILSPIKALQQKLRKDNFEIQVAAGQISASAQKLTLTLADSHAFARQMSAEAQDILQVNESSQKSLAEAIVALKELVKAMENVDHISRQVRVAGSESEKNIRAGLTQIMDILTGIKQVEDSTQEAGASIKQFQETFQAINGILGVVDNIANQTQLLALNASIEAARAGEHGLGFGVVAREIRTLADNSKFAVSEISKLVRKMTEDVKNITETIGRNRHYVQNCVDLSKSVETGLTHMSVSHEKVQDLIQTILQVAEQQYEYALDIGRKVDGVEESFRILDGRFSGITSAIAKQDENLANTEILAQNLLDAERGLSGLIESEGDLIEENQQALQRAAVRATQVLLLRTKDSELNSKTQYKDLLDAILRENDFMEAVWINDRNGRFLYSNPPAQIANANVREWFRRALNGEDYVSSVYISAITHAPCLTVSSPVRDGAGNITGVIGADIKIAV